MTNKELIRRVTQLAEPLCAAGGVSLWDVTFEKEGRSYVLTVFIDKEAGIGIEDCERVSRGLDPLLDAPAFDTLPTYTLTVSSAGLERKIARPEHFVWALGKPVEITFYQARAGQNTLVGTLKYKTDETMVLVLEDGREETLACADVANTRLYFTL